MPVAIKKKNNLVGFRCNYLDCDYKNHGLESVKEHINRYHMNEKPFICDTCGLGFPGKPGLLSHSRIHKIRKHKCDFSSDCKFTTHFRNQLRDHMMRHNNERPYSCTWPGCEQAFVTMKEVALYVSFQVIVVFIIYQLFASFKQTSEAQAFRRETFSLRVALL